MDDLLNELIIHFHVRMNNNNWNAISLFLVNDSTK